MSPRLGLTYDLLGDGNWILNASYATYVSSLVNGIANSGSNAGGAARFDFQYLGPAINLDPNAGTLVSTPGCAAHPVRLVQRQRRHDARQRRRGAARRQPPRLAGSPLAERRRVRRRRDQAARAARAGARRRASTASSRTSTRPASTPTTGQVTNNLGQTFDINIIENTNDVERKYKGLNVSTSWRPTDRDHAGRRLHAVAHLGQHRRRDFGRRARPPLPRQLSGVSRGTMELPDRRSARSISVTRCGSSRPTRCR